MFRSEADILMEAPARCLLRLCRHWSHKFQVELNETQGRIDFCPAGCELLVIEGGLRVRVQTPDEGELDQLLEVVAEHLRRMAGNDLRIDWQR
ncbi:DUF2218 domain-containing protein [Pseudomonas citronellolis]|uniref:DUF2218 domain-containing protein n=1 Tax=Pseudomonas citronellolis TaxID=53408 RepID=UPI0007187881|nr:DUF2218 domain-containing protein [Pseudomonas citronellolis]KRV76346.1 hypothetical protein AO742_12480 [Pseudomonas citronellolis]KRW79619.1 hypothetical protein AO738_13785 [Pseudomonas citronellolis]